MENSLSDKEHETSLAKDSATDSASDTGAGLHILVVEDNQDLLEMLCEMLDMIGHMPVPAASGENALELLQQQRFDVLLTDINLPKMSGIALAKQAMLNAPDMHIVFSSGHGPHIHSYVNFPCHMLTKPYELSQIQQLLEGFLVRR
ncbi:response regulator [Undibacterium sp. CY18W]|uniref:Response regulator n=1 Tax=Undibacterium hunanense TaxID=2762292 RepID=A0ABR6ZRF3_9BURK|nr:response regulator [Undibacterium hunanense]MBC3918463.1 response regulator [Undibacterium hunanense]